LSRAWRRGVREEKLVCVRGEKGLIVVLVRELRR
jgi:hypothetical protein